MKKSITIFPLVGLSITLTFVASFNLHADTTPLVNYQGKLKKNGTNVNGQVNVTFKIYTDTTNTSCVYQESNLVTVVDGLYSTLIGQNPTLGNIADASALDDAYLELTIEGNVMTPREHFTPPPFAKKSTQRWNLFMTFNDTISAFGRTYGSSSLNTNDPCANTFCRSGDSAQFLLPAEQCTLTSAKILLTDFNTSPSPADFQFALQCRLRANDLVTGADRILGPPGTFYQTNTPLRTWLPIPLSTNRADLVLQPTEFLFVDFSGRAFFQTSTNSAVSWVGDYMLDVRVK